MNLVLKHAGIRIDGRWLVRDVSLSIRPKQLTAVVGPNGSGKSTVLRLLAGLWRPTEGRAELEGKSLDRIPRRMIARRVAYLAQSTQIGFAFTSREIVRMGRHPHIGRFDTPSPVDDAAVEAALERADVVHLEDRPVNELSGGECQRVLIARSLATEADAIVFDEPTANLDIDHSLETLRLLKQLAQEGKAVAVALHDLNSVARWADQVALLHEGRLQACDVAERVLRDDLVESVFGVTMERLMASSGVETFVFHRPDDRDRSRRHQ